ncbi:unnamed protein product [Cuscuta europaea]|uniref:Ubiquitin-like protease family profile domain-containing protein n=1 Tax=Cuscuta europaea TaxID=41803 RepID=A0A9P0ZH73_CUSEU|nr:unnamed protein product [Cuscuta europaea]
MLIRKSLYTRKELKILLLFQLVSHRKINSSFARYLICAPKLRRKFFFAIEKEVNDDLVQGAENVTTKTEKEKEAMFTENIVEVHKDGAVRSKSVKGKEKIDEVRVESGVRSVDVKGKAKIVENKEHNKRDTRSNLLIGKNELELRSRRTTKPAQVTKSPFIARAVDPNQPSCTSEKLMWKWVMQERADKRGAILFKYKQVSVTRGDMISIGDKKHMNMNELDAWTIFLNNNEKPRSRTSPCRLFVKLYPCLYTMPDRIPENRSYKVFKQGIELALESVKPDVQMKDVDLFFFPIVQPEHCYVVVFNMKNSKLKCWTTPR